VEVSHAVTPRGVHCFMKTGPGGSDKVAIYSAGRATEILALRDHGRCCSLLSNCETPRDLGEGGENELQSSSDTQLAWA
jgi:hypothetical protein